jgi:hypothetical protein
MEFIKDTECSDWISNKNPNIDMRFTDKKSIPNITIRDGSLEMLPARSILYRTRVAFGWVLKSRPSQLLLWIREYGIWESSEHRPLEQALRSRLPNAGSVETHSGILGNVSDPQDRDDLISFMYLAINFGWGISLIGNVGDRVVHVNHDGHLWIVTSDPEARAEAESLLAP